MVRSSDFTEKITDIIGKIDQGVIVTERELERSFLNAVEGHLKSLNLSPTIEQQRKVVRGRSDARIGGLVFEFKRPNRPIQDLLTAMKQVKGYIDQYMKKDVLLRGILTDGVNIAFVDEDKRLLEKGSLERNVWMLEAWVTALGMKVASPTDLKNSLGPASSVGKALIRELYEGYEDNKKATFLRESYEVWDGVYGCATNLNRKAISAVTSFARNSLGIILHGITDVKAFLFIIETYLSILMKLLVGEVAIQKNIITAPSLEELLGQYVIDSYGKLSQRVPFLARVFEYDTFYWFVDLANTLPQFGKIVAGYLTDIAKILDLMDFTGVSTDLVKQMYQGFFDGATRKALGEFYTPDALVDHVLDAVGYVDYQPLDSTILDPACGSGTFLVRAIDRFIKAVGNGEMNKSEVLRRVTDQIIGIDIHPFAVAMAKVNYLLALGRLIDPTVRRKLGSLHIPVYWADSLARATVKTQFGGTSTIRTIEIRVPVLGTFMLPDPEAINWDKLIDWTLMAVDNDWSDQRYLDSFPQDERLAYKSVLLKFLQLFRDREKKGLDGRWLSTIRNFVVIDRMKGRCDFVVGNPPWVRIHNINEDIRKELIGRFDVYKKDRKGGKVVGWNPKLKQTVVPFLQQIDYCMAFVEAGLNYLEDGGRLGFVITAKIMNALYANLLRQLLLDNTDVLRIVDYSLSDKQFFEEATNYPMILAICRAPPSKTKVTLDAAYRLDWEVEQGKLPLIPSDRQSPWCMAPPKVIEVFRKMQRGNPRLGDLYRVQMGVKTSANSIYLVEDFTPTSTQGIVTVTTEGNEKLNIEENMLRPLVRGRDIDAWGFGVSGYIIWTHDDKTGEVEEKLPSNALDYFNRHEGRLKGRSDYKDGQPIWTIFRVSRAKLKDKVGWGELSKRMETTLLPKDFKDERLGEGRLVAIQTVYSIPVDDLELGYALSALLNSTPVRGFLTSFAERARGRYFRHFAWTVGLVPIPKALAESGRDLSLRELADLSKKMHNAKGEDAALALELDRHVAELYGVHEDDLAELRGYLKACGVPTM